jgi:ABC-2 type transport system ATP-binding protein
MPTTGKGRAGPHSGPAVAVKGLAKTYPGGIEAVKGISFEVAPGEVFGLLGPNGAGKSTTIGMLTCTVSPTGGSARLAGHDVASEPLAARRLSSVVFQDPVVDRALTGRRNLEIHARLWGVEPDIARHNIEEMPNVLGIGEIIDRPVGSYSGGQRRRLEIARALLSEPRVLFLDEPTVGLDPRIRHELLDVVAGLRAHSEMTILMTTHYLDEAERLCDRIAIIHQGVIVALGTPEGLMADLGSEILEVRTANGDGPDTLERLREGGLADGRAFNVGATLTIPLGEHSARQALAALEAFGTDVLSTTTRAPNLDDVYLRLTGDRIAT